MRPTLHLVALPHTQTVHEVTVCAFTSKTVKFCRMMTQLGWRVVLYSGDRNDAICTEHVPLFTSEEQAGWYGEFDPNLLPTIATWNNADVWWRTMNERAVYEIRKRAEPRDLLLLTAGLAQKPIADAIPYLTCCEWAAGYHGIFSKFVCFESYAWRHYLYGVYGHQDGRYYDTVIPNFFDADEWPIPSVTPGEYLLFLGRMTARKGPHVAAQVAAAAGMPIVFAGSGVLDVRPGKITCESIVLEGPDMTYAGTVGIEERNALLAGAYALLCPTQYIEPFGAVCVEAQICGVPALTTDWGAFPELVEEGVTGFRFRTLAEGVEAVRRARSLDRAFIRERALARYSLDAVGPMYERWFYQLDGLWEGGWYGLPAVAEVAA